MRKNVGKIYWDLETRKVRKTHFCKAENAKILIRNALEFVMDVRMKNV